MLILGVDPGSQTTGYGVVASDGRRHQLVEKGAIVAPRRASLPERLRHIHAGIVSLIQRLEPDPGPPPLPLRQSESP